MPRMTFKWLLNVSEMHTVVQTFLITKIFYRNNPFIQQWRITLIKNDFMLQKISISVFNIDNNNNNNNKYFLSSKYAY